MSERKQRGCWSVQSGAREHPSAEQSWPGRWARQAKLHPGHSCLWYDCASRRSVSWGRHQQFLTRAEHRNHRRACPKRGSKAPRPPQPDAEGRAGDVHGGRYPPVGWLPRSAVNKAQPCSWFIKLACFLSSPAIKLSYSPRIPKFQRRVTLFNEHELRAWRNQ